MDTIAPASDGAGRSFVRRHLRNKVSEVEINSINPPQTSFQDDSTDLVYFFVCYTVLRELNQMLVSLIAFVDVCPHVMLMIKV